MVQQLINGLITGILYGIAALGLGLVYGIFYVPNLAHGAFIMFGAYVTLISSSANYFFGLFVAAVTVALMMMVSDLLVYKPLRQKQGTAMNMMIASIGIEYILLNVALMLWTASPRQLPVPWDGKVVSFAEFLLTQQRILVLVFSVVTIIVVWYFNKYTKNGKAMRACAQDMQAAMIIGINTNRVALIVFGISGLMIGLAGGLIGPLTMVTPSMANSLVTKCFAVVILGGATSIPGVLLGGVVLGLAEAITAYLVSPMYIDIAAFLILIIVLLVKPTGIFGSKRQVKV